MGAIETKLDDGLVRVVPRYFHAGQLNYYVHTHGESQRAKPTIDYSIG